MRTEEFTRCLVKKLIAVREDRYGYLKCNLYRNKEFKNPTIHRLVAEAFIPKTDDSLVVNHKDGNKLNNHVSNLEWITNAENIRHAYRIGLAEGASGEDNPAARHTEKQIKEVCRLLEKGARNVDILKKTGVTKRAIEHVKARGTWTHISKKYDF